MSVTIQMRGDTAADWASVNPVLFQREIGVETDTFKAKIGDGVTHWASLPYWTLGTLAVMSVFGRNGAITAQAGDYTAAQVGALALAGGNMLGWLGPKEVTLAQSGGLVAVNAAAGNSFLLPLTASGWTIGVPSNPSPGQKIEISIGQDTSGSRTVAWAAGWNFGAGSAPALTTTPGAVDILVFKYETLLSAWCYVGIAPDFQPPPQNIAFVDGVSSAPTSGNSVSLVLPGDLQAGNQVIIGVCANGATGFTVSSTGVSVPSQFGSYRTGQFASISGLFGFTVQPGDLSVGGGGTATITFTCTGGTPPCTPAAALGAWSGAVLPPGALASSASSATATSYNAPAAGTVANQSWSVEFAMLPDNAFLTTTVPGTVTGRTLNTHQVIAADSNGPVGSAGTPIGGDVWASGASVVWHAWTIALNPV